jgi:hypothetical protein
MPKSLPQPSTTIFEFNNLVLCINYNKSLMAWENHFRSRDLLLWIVIVTLLLISYPFTRCFFDFFFPHRVSGAHAIKETHVTLLCGHIWSFVISLYAQSCPFPTWCGVCRQIMAGLPPIINCLCFFFIFSLMTTKVNNCSFYLLFIKSDMFIISKYLGFDSHVWLWQLR